MRQGGDFNLGELHHRTNEVTCIKTFDPWVIFSWWHLKNHPFLVKLKIGCDCMLINGVLGTSMLAINGK